MKWYKSLLHVIGISVTTLVFAFGITWALSKVSILDPITDSVLDFEFTDQAFKEKNYSQIPVDTNIFIVNVALHSRYQIAGMIDSLNQYNPRVVCMNVIFKSKKQQFVDSILVNSFSKVENLLFVGGITDNQLITSHDLFTSEGSIGSGNLIIGLKNNIRDFSTRSVFNDRGYEHIGLSAARYYRPIIFRDFFQRNNLTETINYIGGIEKYPVIDYTDNKNLIVYTTDSSGNFVANKKLELEDVKDKIILFGFVTGEITKYDPYLIDPTDAFFTPLPYIGGWLDETNFPSTKGIVIQANIISTILNGRYIESSLWFNFLTNILIVLLSASLFLFISNRSPKHFGLITKGLALFITLALIFFTIYIFKTISFKYDPRWAILVLLFLSDSTEIYKQYIIKSN